MMNVKETLKRLHKRLPTLSLDELFELLDCYVEQIDFSRTISTWEPSKVWYSTDKSTGVNRTPEINCVTTSKVDPEYITFTNCSDGKLKYYDGGGATQFVANH